MGQRGRSWGSVVSSTAAISELSSVKGASAGGAPRKAVPLWCGDAVCRRRGGGTAWRRAATD